MDSRKSLQIEPTKGIKLDGEKVCFANNNNRRKELISIDS